MRRRHVHVVHKSAGLTTEHVRAIMRVYIVVRSDLTWQQQWRVAFGIGLCTMYKTLARYDDLRQLRYDSSHFTVTDLMIDCSSSLARTTRSTAQGYLSRDQQIGASLASTAR